MAENKMLNIAEIINQKDRMRDLVIDFHAQLDRVNWPKTFYVKDGKTFQDLVVALRVEVDWHFDEGNEGFSYFLMGPTMVRVDNQGQPDSARANLLSPKDKFVTEWQKNESVGEEFKAKITEMVEDGDLRVEEMISEGGPIDAGSESEETS